MIFYEAPHKLSAALSDLAAALGDREIAIVRELTKIHEQVIRTTLCAAAEKYSAEPLKGEIVLIISGAPRKEAEEMTLEQAVAYANQLMDALQTRYTCKIVITGIHLNNGGVANLGDDGSGNRFFSQQPECGHSYPGTGDIFASVLLGELLRNAPFDQAVERAADFVAHLIRASVKIDTPVREGVALEPELWRLIPSNERR
jgi:hypothetical protein